VGLFGKVGPVIGVDVGTNSVKVVQMKTTAKGLVLERIAIVPIRLTEGKGNVTEASDAAVAEAVKTAVVNSGTSIKDVCCSIAGESVIVRYLQFPDMPNEELDYTVRLQAEEYIPFHLTDVNLDYQRLDTPTVEGGKRVDLLLVAVRKDLVSRRVELLKSIGLSPVVMDVDSFALLNCLEANYDFRPDEVVALVSIGASITNINIFIKSISRFARDISLGGNSITSAIASKLSISFQDAEKTKISEGIVFTKEPGAGGGEVSGVAEAIKGTVEKITGEKMDDEDKKTKLAGIIRQPIQNLITEVRRSLQFFENQPNGKPVTRVLLTGGGAKLQNLDKYMSDRLGLPVEIADPLKKIDISMVSKVGFDVKSQAPTLAVGIGLGLRKAGDK
jgi:type IV pilus assembly protein PilM